MAKQYKQYDDDFKKTIDYKNIKKYYKKIFSQLYMVSYKYKSYFCYSPT